MPASLTEAFSAQLRGVRAPCRAVCDDAASSHAGPHCHSPSHSQTALVLSEESTEETFVYELIQQEIVRRGITASGAAPPGIARGLGHSHDGATSRCNSPPFPSKTREQVASPSLSSQGEAASPGARSHLALFGRPSSAASTHIGLHATTSLTDARREQLFANVLKDLAMDAGSTVPHSPARDWVTPPSLSTKFAAGWAVPPSPHSWQSSVPRAKGEARQRLDFNQFAPPQPSPAIQAGSLTGEAALLKSETRAAWEACMGAFDVKRQQTRLHAISRLEQMPDGSFSSSVPADTFDFSSSLVADSYNCSSSLPADSENAAHRFWPLDSHAQPREASSHTSQDLRASQASPLLDEYASQPRCRLWQLSLPHEEITTVSDRLRLLEADRLLRRQSLGSALLSWAGYQRPRRPRSTLLRSYQLWRRTSVSSAVRAWVQSVQMGLIMRERRRKAGLTLSRRAVRGCLLAWCRHNREAWCLRYVSAREYRCKVLLLSKYADWRSEVTRRHVTRGRLLVFSIYFRRWFLFLRVAQLARDLETDSLSRMNRELDELVAAALRYAP